MIIDFNCVATGIGSLPHTDPVEAAELSIRSLGSAPFWPQLPQRNFREHMDVQYSESLPGLVLDDVKRKVFFNSARDLTPDLERFFERYLAKDYGYFRISEEYAPGFTAFIRALRHHRPQGLRFVKGHITGPLTAGISFKDEAGKDIVHNDLLYDAVVKGLAMKAAWQVQELKQFGTPVIIFIDEPAMETLGSAFSAVSAEVVAGKLNEIIDTIHEAGALAGIHCCGNADWPLIFGTGVDIVNFDAFGYLERVLLYPDDIRKFYGRGGALAWGIVPTGAFTGRETADQLISLLENGITRLGKAGIGRATVLRQCLITPSCGMGSLTQDKALAILNLLTEIAARLHDRR